MSGLEGRTVGIVNPAPPGLRGGNRVTALRWARMLRGLGARTFVRRRYDGEDCDVLVALHATKAHDSILLSRHVAPERPIVVGLGGTDVYHDLNNHPETRASLELADRIVVLQPLAAEELPAGLRDRVRVIYQSAPKPAGEPQRDSETFEVCLIGNLRPVKDPLLAARAARLLPQDSRVRVL
ncbi:MAG: TIGR04348 family glycosyltransferase, partial [Planctomycetota bacterium]|nr:TIGR04348 family glycosyltransferase [Planctomycetota bacterium]